MVQKPHHASRNPPLEVSAIARLHESLELRKGSAYVCTETLLG